MTLTLPKSNFQKKIEKLDLDNHMNNVMPKIRNCGLNSMATIEKTFIRTTSCRT